MNRLHKCQICEERFTGPAFTPDGVFAGFICSACLEDQKKPTRVCATCGTTELVVEFSTNGKHDGWFCLKHGFEYQRPKAEDILDPDYNRARLLGIIGNKYNTFVKCDVQIVGRPTEYEWAKYGRGGYQDSIALEGSFRLIASNASLEREQ